MNTEDRARVYADAFYAAGVERWIAALEGAAGKLAAERDLTGRLQASDTEFAARQPALNALLTADADAPVRNLVYTLAQRGDLALLADIAGALRARQARADVTSTRVEVVSAVALTAAEQQALAEKLSAKHGANLEFHYRVDPAILGGLIVRVGDQLIDGSVASRLAAMKQALGVND
jgi:F-type H+-transporting ATPase subunit delta